MTKKFCIKVYILYCTVPTDVSFICESISFNCMHRKEREISKRKGWRGEGSDGEREAGHSKRPRGA